MNLWKRWVAGWITVEPNSGVIYSCWYGVDLASGESWTVKHWIRK